MSSEPSAVTIMESSEPCIMYTITMDMDAGWDMYLFGEGTRFLYGMCYPAGGQIKVHLYMFDASRIERQPNGKLFMYSNNFTTIERDRMYPNREAALDHVEFKHLWDMHRVTPLEDQESEFGVVVNRNFDVLLF